MPFTSLKDIIEQLPISRKAFEVEVERVAREVTDEAKKISPAIGEISIQEAKAAVIREFTERLSHPR